jgi:hypothetical protein
MVSGLDVATLARAWTSENYAGKPRSGDRGYEKFNLHQVPFGRKPSGSLKTCQQMSQMMRIDFFESNIRRIRAIRWPSHEIRKLPAPLQTSPVSKE